MSGTFGIIGNISGALNHKNIYLPHRNSGEVGDPRVGLTAEQWLEAPAVFSSPSDAPGVWATDCLPLLLPEGHDPCCLRGALPDRRWCSPQEELGQTEYICQGGKSFLEVQNRFLTPVWSKQGQMATTKPITGWISWDCHHAARPMTSFRVMPCCLDKIRVCRPESGCLGRSGVQVDRKLQVI